MNRGPSTAREVSVKGRRIPGAHVYPRPSNYILFSDVHLGADLVQHVRPWTVSRLKKVAKIDRDLSAMIDWYREHVDEDRPWRLVIAGDLVDFVGMSIAPLPDTNHDLTAEERVFGLGSTREHAEVKMRAVAERHALVFERLAAFVADGHSLVLVRGNHDIDFHWDTAQRAFVDAIVHRVPGADENPERRAELEARIELHPWFYYEEDFLYVEHGHQFDAMCSYHHLLAPVSPQDPRRISWSFSDILLRTIVRPTRGLGSHGHEGRTMLDYVRFGLSLGLLGALRLAYRYFAAIGRALRRWREHLSERAHELRWEHERRMEEVAQRMRLEIGEVRALAALWPTPVTRGALDVLRALFLDRALVLAALSLGVVAAVVLLPAAAWVPIAAVLVSTALAFLAWSGRRRVDDVDPTGPMTRAARRIAELIPTRFVVMGHTHEPALEPNGSGTYVNLGHWGADVLDDEHAEAPRTHLVLRWVDGAHRAEFLRWVPGRGPVAHASDLAESAPPTPFQRP